MSFNIQIRIFKFETCKFKFANTNLNNWKVFKLSSFNSILNCVSTTINNVIT